MSEPLTSSAPSLTPPAARARSKSVRESSDETLLVGRRTLPPWLEVRLSNGALKLTPYRKLLFWLPPIYAAITGFGQAWDQRFNPLDPDVINFMGMAQGWTLQSFWGGFREPVWPALLALPIRLFGPSTFIPRVLGVLGFILLTISVLLLVRRLYGVGWGFLAGIAIAASPWLIFQSARGLREETSAALVVLFGLGMVGSPWNGRRATAMWAVAGIGGMLRWELVIITVPTLLVAHVVSRPQWWSWVAGPLAFALIVLPLLGGNYQQSGDPFYSSNILARGFRNLEFEGQPGFPTVAAVEKDLFTGPPITWIQYIFGLHTPQQLIVRSLHGLQDIILVNGSLAWTYPDSQQPPDGWPTTRIFENAQFTIAWMMLIFGIVGALSMLRTRAWPIALMLPLSMSVISLLAFIMDYRLALPVLPLTLVADLEGMAFLFPRPFWAVERSVARLFGPSVQGSGTKVGSDAGLVADSRGLTL
jgi:hypothetical protein